MWYILEQKRWDSPAVRHNAHTEPEGWRSAVWGTCTGDWVATPGGPEQRLGDWRERMTYLRGKYFTQPEYGPRKIAEPVWVDRSSRWKVRIGRAAESKDRARETEKVERISEDLKKWSKKWKNNGEEESCKPMGKGFQESGLTTVSIGFKGEKDC